MPHCPRCGNELLEFAQFCPACGQPAAQPTPVPEPSGGRTSSSLPLGQYLKTGWGLFLNYPGGFIGFFLIYLVIQSVLHFIPWLGGIASFVIGPALLMGNFIVSAKLIQGRGPQFSDFFLGFRFFIPLLLTALVGGTLTGIGLLVTVPLTCCTITAAYADICGLQSDYSEGFPDNVTSMVAAPGANDHPES